MLEAFQRWIKRFGSRPWDDELQKAFEAGYRAGMRHDQAMKYAPRTRNRKPHAPKPVEIKRDLYLETLLQRAKETDK